MLEKRDQYLYGESQSDIREGTIRYCTYNGYPADQAEAALRLGFIQALGSPRAAAQGRCHERTRHLASTRSSFNSSQFCLTHSK